LFCIVSGLSFFFRSDKVAQRLGMGTSMLISAVMFHISQTASLPPLGSLILVCSVSNAFWYLIWEKRRGELIINFFRNHLSDLINSTALATVVSSFASTMVRILH
jgi:hypothetical protein